MPSVRGKSAANCHLSKCLFPSWRSRLNLCRCRIRHQKTTWTHSHSGFPRPTLNPASRHRLLDMTFIHLPACQRRRGQGPAAAVHIATVLVPARSACPSRQFARIKAESSAPPSAPWHQSGLAMHKTPLYKHCWCWWCRHKLFFTAMSVASCQLLHQQQQPAKCCCALCPPAATPPLAVLFPRSVGGVAVICLRIFLVLSDAPELLTHLKELDN